MGPFSNAKTSPTQVIKTVAAIGTPERLASARGDHTFNQAIFIAKKAARTSNVGNVYWGAQSGNDTQPYEMVPDDVLFVPASNGEKLDLYDFWLDVATANDGLVIIYW